MKNKRFIKIALVVLLCVAMVLPFVPMYADAAPVNFDAANIGTTFKGKKLSILGDSISTFAGVSNDSSANSTIGSNAVYYTVDNDYGVTREDTWWQQAIDKLDMQLCVNNSWSGSMVWGDQTKSDGTSYDNAAWKNRCVQLHNALTGNPDIIAVYMGTNDIKNVSSGISTFANNKDDMLTEAAGTGTSVKKFSLYIRMVNKMIAAYPDAQIYLFTLLPNDSQNDIQLKAMDQYNQSIRDLVTYYQGEGEAVYLVDLHDATSITGDFEILKKHLANRLHPNAEGMDAITNCFLSSLVHNSGWATNRANWREVQYDLKDVYVSGGQINTLRMSSSTDVPFSVSLLPARPEYDLEVSVKAHKVGKPETDAAANWDDITSAVYSGGTVYIKRLHYSTYDYVKITAKAVYKTKNFRWELKDGSLESVTVDGKDYSTRNGITFNDTTLETGSYANDSFSKAQYGLQDSIMLRNEEPWVIEWKASGAMGSDVLFFSGNETSNARTNNFVFYNYEDDGVAQLFIGCYNGRSQYWNYGIAIPETYTRAADTSHVYRLINKVASDGSNMVYLLIDGEEIGPMNTYYVGDDAQTGDLATQTWLNGRDFEFSFFGAASSHLLNDCSIEYIQVWEGGEFDSLRLEQLIEEFDNELSVSMKDAVGFSAYQTAVNNAKTYLNGLKDQTNSQEKYDAYVDAILAARNELTKAADATQIYSVELITRNYVQIGKPAALKVITTPDVEKIQVGNTAQTLITNTSSLQTLKIDGVETEVKVWLVSWLREWTSEKLVEYRIHALKDSSDTASKDEHGDASVTFKVPFGANCFSDLRVTAAPTKTEYSVGETFDATGMEVTAYFGDGTTYEVVTDYTVTFQNGSTTCKSTDTYVTIKYTVTFADDSTGYLTVKQPIEVIVEES